MLYFLGLSAMAGLVCVGHGCWLLRQSKGASAELRLAAWLTPVVMLILSVVYLERIGRGLDFDWNANRLAPTVAMMRGYDLYYGPNEGPVLNTLYGPVTALVYVPAVVASTPTGAVLLASAISVLLVLAPILLLNLCRPAESFEGHMTAMAGFAISAAAILAVSSTEYMATAIHGDAPAVGLGLLSCILLIGCHRHPSTVTLGLAAGLGVLAVWAKQIEAPLLLAQIVFLGLAYGRKVMFRYLSLTIAIGLLVSLVFVGRFGWDAMFFNMFTLPGRHPWKGGVIWLSGAFVEIVVQMLWLLAAILPAVVSIVRDSRARGQTWSDFLQQHSWLLLLIVALFLVPTGALGCNKFGGDNNSYHSHYYLIAALGLILSRYGLGQIGVGREQFRRRLVLVAAAVCVCLSIPSFGNLRSLTKLNRNPQQLAYEFTLAHPGEAYFPWNCLSTLMADGKLYHFDYGVLDRELAGFSVSNSHFREYLPPHLRYVPVRRKILDYLGYPRPFKWLLPEFSQRAELDRLPSTDWVVFVRDTEAGEISSSGTTVPQTSNRKLLERLVR